MAHKLRQDLVTAVQQTLFAEQIPTVELTYRTQSPGGFPQVIHSQDMYTHALKIWDPLKINLCEEFKVGLLNQANRVLGISPISQGGISATYVDPRFVICAAILANATSIILMHNHPSGNLRPSAADKLLTAKIKAAAEHLQITVLDHLIVTNSGYFSFAEEGIL